MRRIALILAGGRGERFWPSSRENRPKQFLSLTDDGVTMLQRTALRTLSLVGWEDIYVSTNDAYAHLVREQLPGLPEENILCEPVSRGTAPCIGLAAAMLVRKFGDAMMFVLPSDHMIKYAGMLRDSLLRAEEAAADGCLVTIGITPTYPETEYGYIKFDASAPSGTAYPVEQISEKPDRETARSYIESEHYLWNSGMFVWRCSSILGDIARYLPEVTAGLARIGAALGTPEEREVLEREYAAFPSVSIDCGVMEKADDVMTVPGSFGWDDLGSWLALGRLSPPDEFGNTLLGELITMDVRNCVVRGGDKLLALVGVEDLIVADSPDATLICSSSRAPEIRKILQQLRLCGRDDLL